MQARLGPAQFHQAVGIGLVGGSIEDATGNPDQPLFDIDTATMRIKAAVEAARSLPVPFVLTARAEGFLRGKPDLGDVIKRLEPIPRAHNTVFGLDGKQVYMAGIGSPLLHVADTDAALERAREHGADVVREEISDR